MATCQESLEQVISRVGSAFEDGLIGVNKTIEWQLDKKFEEGRKGEDGPKEVTESLSRLHAEMRGTRDLCENLRSQFSEWNQAEAEALRTTYISRQEELAQKLEQRGNTLEGRELNLQGLISTFTSKMSQVWGKIKGNKNDAKDALQETIYQVQERFEASLLRERAWSAQKLVQMEAAVLELRDHVRNLTQIERGSTETPAQQNVEKLHLMLQEERGTVARLTENIHSLEKEAKLMTGLRERWTRDLWLIDSLRSQLSAIRHRMPQVESMAAKLDSISLLNSFIHSTASYLSNEKKWIQGELTTRDNGSSSAGSSQLRAVHEQTRSTDSKGPATEGSIPGVNTGCSVAAGPHGISTRRVTVCCPTLELDPPSPPLSVEQEQIKRREAAKPRPILRFTAKPSQSPKVSGPAAEELGASFSYSQYNRPVMVRSAQTGEDARSGRKRNPSVSMDDIHRIGKRFKPEPPENVPGDLTTPSIKTSETARGKHVDGIRGPRRIVHTYSRNLAE
ncbi:hypothetical protein GMORB2_0873 [Geosmithia morbida]|uniref:Uncharacterized protein n=1 Tax=Geosmithia morbida TaxID=1094350 RepID=A0A9P5D8K9_9HYPO|nr:uncharacterized protein GMORB2_0873 [Geosmithia morbida]KAF4125629.1 hypothetical protein GMORB2_0873 [Geosmithia morbida]